MEPEQQMRQADHQQMMQAAPQRMRQAAQQQMRQTAREEQKHDPPPNRPTHQAGVPPPPGLNRISVPEEEEESDEIYIPYRPLYIAVDNGNLEATMQFLNRDPDALTARISASGETALHIAVLAGRVKIVEALVRRMAPQHLTIATTDQSTALNFAALGGTTKIAEILVEKNTDLLLIHNQVYEIPVVAAARCGKKDLMQYLYKKTPAHVFDPLRETGEGPVLLNACIDDEFYDIALDLLLHYPTLAISTDREMCTALHILARKPFAFPSGTQLPLWRRLIYNCIHVHVYPSLDNFHRKSMDIESSPGVSPVPSRNLISRVLYQLLDWFWRGLGFLVPIIDHTYDLKLTHAQAQELLRCICREISTLGESQFDRLGLRGAVFLAVTNGILEIIEELLKDYPEVVWYRDYGDRNLLFVAILERRENIYKLICEMGAKKNALASNWDAKNNTILHAAAYLAPFSQLNRISGAAMQMQRELQWFKEVERIVQPKYKELGNVNRETPRALFTAQHKKLVEDGEKWTKETAASCAVVAALIVTIMFSGAFTVPGGYDDNTGDPKFLQRNSFLVFIISDAISLFSSTASLLMFLGILTSRYREEDFLKSLPRKLTMGLSMLFLSIAAMMISYGVTILIMLQKRIAWVSFPIISLASLPVILFAVLQFPLLVDLLWSTYGPGIFYRPSNSCLSRFTYSTFNALNHCLYCVPNIRKNP